MKLFKKIISLFSLTILFIVPSCSINLVDASKLSYKKNKVNQIFDGDTFSIDSNIKIRLFGIDTPELAKENDDIFSLQNIFANKAKEFLISKIKDSDIWYKSIVKDKYGRYVSIVKINNTDLSLEILKKGLGIVRYISFNSSDNFPDKNHYLEQLILIQNKAKEAKIGIWAYFSTKNWEEIFPNSNIKIF